MSKDYKTIPNLLLGIISIIIFAFISCGASKKINECDQFRNGRFIFHIRSENFETEFLINRNDSIQIETEVKTGNTSKLFIKWTGECKYELILLETTFDYPDSIQLIRKSIPVKTEILSWTNDYYTFQSKRDDTDFIVTDTLWIDK